ncbi:kinesin-like protein KIF20A [Formica exsecta]|uniref:kinesin-like protein KIF20A n=1 Tax=Formica exsecta TaxID=72781 RepID=UPI001141F6E0|nr:kinesin-like protein KIF20A [Formica exsecta]
MTPIGKNSSVEMYLRIKPAPVVIKEEENIYQILDPSILRMKTPPSLKTNNKNSIRKWNETHVFTKIFGSETLQAEMFERSIKHRVTEFLDGKSSTIMTYGAKKAGKTYTLFGTSTSPGIIPRSIQLVFSKIKYCCHLPPWIKQECQDNFYLDEIFGYLKLEEQSIKTCTCKTCKTWHMSNSNKIMEQTSKEEAMRFLICSSEEPENPDEYKKCDNGYSYEVWLSFIEIYEDDVYDLLEGMSIPAIIEKEKQSYLYKSQVQVRTALQACQIFLIGQSRMKTSATASNPERSLSHTIFKINLVKYENHASSIATFSTLTFCDLASPILYVATLLYPPEIRINDINLSVLNKCLMAMSENQAAPFHKSKLTAELQSVFSGQENLSLIVNLSLTPKFNDEKCFQLENIFKFCDATRKLIDIYKQYKKSDEFEVTSSEECENNVISPPFIHRTSSETAEKATSTEYIDWEAYENIQEQNEKLMKELETTRSDIVNREYATRKELADHYSRMIEEMEATYKKHTKDIETERRDLLKSSIELVENFYKERIDNLMRHKKRKRGDDGDYIEDSHALYEELETENAQVTSKMMVLKETMKKLKDENKTILCKKNKCSFELALITKELKKFRQLTRSRIQKWDSNTESDPDHLINNLECLMYGMIKTTEMKLEKINEYICATKDEDVEAASKGIIVNQELSKSENLLNDTLIKMKKLEEELSRKEVYIVTLKDRIQMQEGQLTEVQQCLNDIKDDNMKNQKCEYNRSTNISSHDYAIDSSFEHDNVLISSTKKNSLNMSSPTADKCNFVDWIIVPKSTPTHAESAEKKLSNIFDIDRESFFENNSSMDCSEIASRSSDKSNKDDSGVSSGLQNESRRSTSINDSTHTRENEDTQTCLIEENTIATERSADLKKQNHGETLHVTELSEDLKIIKDVIYTLNEAACVNERKIIQHEYQLLYEEEAQERSIKNKREIAIKRDAKVIKNKMQKYKCEINELTRKLIVKKENEDRTSKSLDRYIERSKSLENKLSSMHNQLDKASDKCANEHLPRIESLEDEVLQKTLQINDLDGKIVQMQHKFAKSYELFEKINDFEIIMKKCQRDKNELGRQLYECLETQLILEDKLKELTTKITERESKIISLTNEICNITDVNKSNNEKARNLSKQVIEASKNIDSAKKDLQYCKDLRKNVENVTKLQINFESRFSDYKNNTGFLNKICKMYDDSQDEIIRLKTQLEHNELEISRFKNSIHAITQKYKNLLKHLQNKITEKDEQFKTVVNNLNDLEKSFTENSALSEIIDSSYEFKPTEDPEQSIEYFKVDEADCSLTDSISLVSNHVNSDVLDVSSISNEDSTIFQWDFSILKKSTPN